MDCSVEFQVEGNGEGMEINLYLRWNSNGMEWNWNGIKMEYVSATIIYGTLCIIVPELRIKIKKICSSELYDQNGYREKRTNFPPPANFPPLFKSKFGIFF